ncbi:hypothetical protein [Streptomyces minutiscleroticus]|nr:hypothetical protein [Streptomyces minutiscleroticus]
MAQGPDFKLVVRDVQAGDDAVWVGVAGVLGLDELQLLTEAVAQLAQGEDGTRRVVLDLSGVSYCSRDSAFALWGMCAGFEAMGVRARLAEVSTMARIAVVGARLNKRFSFLER